MGTLGKTADSFGADLARMGMEAVEAPPGGTGDWIALSTDTRLSTFRKKLERRIRRGPNYVDRIRGIGEAPPEIGRSLKERPIVAGEQAYLDVEIRNSDGDEPEETVAGLSALIKDGGGDVTDEIYTDNLCAMRVKCGKGVADELSALPDIAGIDRPPRPPLKRGTGAGSGGVIQDAPAPPPDSPAVLVVDSGISRHPVLTRALAGHVRVERAGGLAREEPEEDRAGHGTGVASVALYGDVGAHVGPYTFNPRSRLYSAKVMYYDGMGAVYDDERVLEGQIKEAVEAVAGKDTNFRLVNVSLGNPKNVMVEGRRQFRIAGVLDELSMKHKKVMFVVSAGNYLGPVRYPGYLTDEDEAAVIDPATSVHGMTVGSVYTGGPGNRDYFPSEITRTGPGLQGMIKPDLVENGGAKFSGDPSPGGADPLVASHRWAEEDPFVEDNGTSISAPAVTYCLSRLMSEFPGATRNRLAALLLSSASPPTRILSALKRDGDSKEKAAQRVTSVYGYGRPLLERAAGSGPSRVLLFHEGAVAPGDTEIFQVLLPKEFGGRGIRTIEAALAFDPPVRRSRAAYMGVTMGYSLYKNTPVEEVRMALDRDSGNGQGGRTGGPAKISMVPGSRLRSKGAHQKSTARLQGARIDTKHPLVLAVSCRRTWHDEKNYRQPYAVVLTVGQEGNTRLYGQIRASNMAKARARGSS